MTHFFERGEVVLLLASLMLRKVQNVTRYLSISPLKSIDSKAHPAPTYFGSYGTEKGPKGIESRSRARVLMARAGKKLLLRDLHLPMLKSTLSRIGEMFCKHGS